MKSTNLLSLYTTFIVAISTFSLSHTNISAQEAKNPKDWKCGSFPKISDSSNALLFTVEHSGDLTKKIKALKFNGTVDIQTGIKLIKKNFVINKFKTPTSIGKFEIVMTKDKLKVTGKHENIKALTVTLKGKEIKNFSRSWSNNTKTYDFEGIGKGANVSISYWQGLETKSISFSY